MSDRVGTHAIDFLESRAAILVKTQARTRREDVATLIPQASKLVADSEAELAQDKQIASDAATKFRQKFSASPMSREAQAYKIEIVTPAQQHVHAAELALKHARAARESVVREAQPVEVRSLFGGGICGVYNELTGKVDWKTQIDGGIAGVYDPVKADVQWVSQLGGGAAVVREASGEIVSKRTIGSGIAGYVDPATGKAQFITDFDSGVAAIVDDKGVLHQESHLLNGVAAYVDPADGKVKFTDPKYHEGVAAVYRYGNSYRSSCGYAPADDQ
jgi:hypothetical protein